MIKVIPAIIPIKSGQLEREVSLVRDFVSLIQVDILDGVYAPMKTFSFATLPGGVDFELDLMIKNPEDSLDEWIGMNPEALIIHFESSEKLEKIIKKIKKNNIKVGIALKPSTPNEEIYPLIGKIDFVQFMGNDKIGYHGVELDERIFNKVAEMREKYPNLDIAVDIGVNRKTAPKLIEAGVNKLVSGSAILGTDNIEESID